MATGVKRRTSLRGAELEFPRRGSRITDAAVSILAPPYPESGECEKSLRRSPC